VVLVVDERRTQHVEAAQFIECVDVLADRGRNAVLRKQFGDGPVLALTGGPVVAPDIEEQSVLGVAKPVQLVNEPADLDVDVLGVSGGHLHQVALEWLLVLRNAVPRGQRFVALGEFAVLRNPASR